MEQSSKIGPYAIGGVLGRGTAGVVLSARHVRTRASVALKVMTQQGARSEAYRAIFRAEARAAAALNHPNVVRLLDQGEVSPEAARALRLPTGAPFLVMERVNGGALRPMEGRLALERTLRVLLDVLAGLAHVHARGLVHRDVKPGNVLLHGVERRAKITDFGIVQRLDAELRCQGAAAGTPNYMPPEQALGLIRDLGPWSDLYALGCVAWKLFTGEAPFDDPDPERVIEQQIHDAPPAFEPRIPAPEGLEGWLRRLLEKEPERRFQLAADAAWALQRVAEGHGLPQRGRAPPIAVSWRNPEHQPAPWRWHGASGLALYSLREAPFVGREAERDQLWEALRRVAAEGAPRAVLIHGPSGSGKSRLASWLGRCAEATGAALPLRALHSPEGGPLDGIRGALAHQHRTFGLKGEALRQHLRLRLAREGVHDPSEAQLLASLLAPEPDDPLSRARPEQRWAVLHREMRRLAAGRVGLLILDDAQWGPDALAMLPWLLHRAPPIPLLVVLTAQDEAAALRPEVAERLQRLRKTRSVESLRLEALPAAEHRALVEQLAGLEPRLAERVSRRTHGFPLFAVQLVGDWIHRGLLEPGPQGLRLWEGTEPPLPDSLHELWVDRISPALAELGPEARRAVELGAVLGLQVDDEEWAQACAIAGLACDTEAVEVLMRHALALPSRGGWRWVHGMAQESVLRLAGERGQAQALHLAAAEMLASQVGPGVAGRRANHLVAAGRRGEALGPMLAACRELQDQGAVERSALPLARARELSAHVPADDPLHGRLATSEGEQARLESRLDESCAHYEAAEACFREANDTAGLLDVLKKHEWALRHLGRMDEGRERLAEAEALLDEHTPPTTLGSWRHSRANAALTQGDLAGAEAFAREGLTLLGDYEGPGARRARAYLLEALTRALIARGVVEGVQDMLQEAIDIWEGDLLHGDVCNGLCILGEVHRLAGELEQADAAYQRAIDAALSLGLPSTHVGVPTFNQGMVRLQRGQAEAAEQRFLAARQHLRAEEYPFFHALTWLAQASCVAAQGEWERWPALMDLAEQHLPGGSVSDPDLLQLLRISKRAAAAAGQAEALARASALEAEHARRLGMEV